LLDDPGGRHLADLLGLDTPHGLRRIVERCTHIAGCTGEGLRNVPRRLVDEVIHASTILGQQLRLPSLQPLPAP
jgi:hypothetical protein